MTINRALLAQTLEHVEKLAADPAATERGEAWVQKVWRCETGCCFAGWALLLGGGRWAMRTAASTLAYRPGQESNDEPGYVADVAQDMLGLDGCQADVLFSADNRIDDLRRIVGRLLADPQAYRA